MAPPSLSRVKLLALLSRSCLSLLPENWQSPCERRLVPLRCLLRRCRLPRCLAKAKTTPAPDLCSSRARPHPHWLEEKKIFPSPLTESQLTIFRVHLTLYRSRATVAAFRVHSTRYRPRATVAAMNYIAAAARAAKVEFPFSISRRQLSFQACTLLEYVATLDCIA